MKSDRESERDVRDQFDNSFNVPLPPAAAWPILSDIRRVAGCVPGASLTEVVDDKTYQGTMTVPLGPATVAFAIGMNFDELDPVQRTARLQAKGADDKGRGGAQGTVSFRLEPADGGSKVLVHTDLVLSGTVAQFGRGGAASVIEGAAAKIMNQFVANLSSQLAGGEQTTR